MTKKDICALVDEIAMIRFEKNDFNKAEIQSSIEKLYHEVASMRLDIALLLKGQQILFNQYEKISEGVKK